MVMATIATPMRPRTKPGREREPKPPKSASIKPSSVLSKSTPIARAAVKTTPIAVSPEIEECFSICQIRIAPMAKAKPPPISELILIRIATASPGRAMWDITSPARDMRFIRAKLPTTPATPAVRSIRTKEYI